MAAESTQLQQAQLAAILGPDPAPFETLIFHLMSTGNEQRSQADSIFILLEQNDPNSLALKLAHLLSSSVHDEARAMATILLRTQLTRDDSFIWPQLNELTRSSVKNFLLTAINNEESESIIRKLSHTVSELASSLLPDNQWPEILPFMFQCVTSSNTKLQESAFLMFSQLAQFMGETLITDLHKEFLNALNNSPSPNVKIAALSAVINFILTTPNDRDRFQDLLPAMMRTLTTALNTEQEATAQEALKLLIELAGTEPLFLDRKIVGVVSFMLQIGEADIVEEGTRHLVIEFVITLAEARERAPGMMGKLPQFISRLFAILMTMLLDVEDDPGWHSAEAKDEDSGETSNYSVGKECLYRLGIALGGNTIVPVAFEQLPPYLSAPESEWQKHHAALIALAQISEGCSKVMIKNLDQVVNMILNSFQHPHPRVRWAAINAIGQLSIDLGPDLQVQYHQLVLPALSGHLDDIQNPRIQEHAASAVLNFSENCSLEIFKPYFVAIVLKLFSDPIPVWLQGHNIAVQRWYGITFRLMASQRDMSNSYEIPSTSSTPSNIEHITAYYEIMLLLNDRFDDLNLSDSRSEYDPQGSSFGGDRH